jgi:hypothetical protein
MSAALSLTTGDLVVHPAAMLLPAMTDDEFTALVADIRLNGLQQPLVRTPSGALLDGRSRWHACQMLGQEPRWVTHRGDPWAFAIGANLHRRRLTPNRRALIAAALADRGRGRGATPDLPPTREQAERLLNVTNGAADRAKRVLRSGSPALVALTAAGGAALNTAARIAALPPETQDRFVAEVEAGADPRKLGRPSGPFFPDTSASITQRDARYRYVQEPALRVLADSLDGLALVLAGAEGLDPALTAEQAAQWSRGLSQRVKSIRLVLRLLRERSK